MIVTLFAVFLCSCVLALFALIGSLRFIRRRRRLLRSQVDGKKSVGSIGVFHPYCSAGGGGERVLWFTVQALQEVFPQSLVVIYANSDAGSKEKLLDMAAERFGATSIDVQRLNVIYLKQHKWLEAERYPRFTLLGQSLGSMVVAREALEAFEPDLFVDSMGYSFSYPMAWLHGCDIACYTHYPTISTDMLSRVFERRPSYNNDEAVAGSVVNSRFKYVYYLLFCKLYELMGKFPDLVIVNSNWTGSHINTLWKTCAKVIFPPCDITEFSQAATKQKVRQIVSLGQFRPEKDHRLQLRALARLKEILKEETPPLVMFGSCRDEEDAQRVEELKTFAEKLGVLQLTQFRINTPFNELKAAMGESLLGVHTMWNEHFGIAPVEMMAAGILLVAHNSGGPKVDIIMNGKTGFLADSAEEYADHFAYVLNLFDAGDENGELDKMRELAITSLDRFSQDNFSKQMKQAFADMYLSS